MARSPEAIYLEEVLGIEGFVRPAHSAVSAFQSAQAVVVLSDVPLVNGRLELLKKMMASIQIHDFVALDCTREDHERLAGIEPKAVVFLGESTLQLIQGWPQKTQFNLITQVNLPSLTELTDTSDMNRLQAVKREAWARLQSFQKEM